MPIATQSEVTECDGITHVISITTGGPSRPRPSQSYIFYHSLPQNMIYSNSAVIIYALQLSLSISNPSYGLLIWVCTTIMI